MQEAEHHIESFEQSPELNENIAETTKWVVRLTFMGELGLHRKAPTPDMHFPDMGVATYFESSPSLSNGTQLVPTYLEFEEYDTTTPEGLEWQGWESVCAAITDPPLLPAQDPAIAEAHWRYFELGQLHGAITPEGSLNPQFKMALDIMRQKVDPQHDLILPLLKTAFQVNQWANIPTQDFREHITDVVSHEAYTDFNDYLAAHFAKLDLLTQRWVSTPPEERPYPITYTPIPFVEEK